MGELCDMGTLLRGTRGPGWWPPRDPSDLVPVPQVDKGVVPLAGTDGETTTQGE